MSLRSEPSTLAERVDWIEEFIRRWEVSQFDIPLTDEACERHTLLYHHPGALSVVTGEPYYPAFMADIFFVRTNVATTPTTGSCVVDLLIDGVSAFTSATKPTINVGSVYSLNAIPDVAYWTTNQKLQIEIESTGDATGLVVAIEHCRLGDFGS